MKQTFPEKKYRFKATVLEGSLVIPLIHKGKI